jgi:UDP-glucose 4-epimerase
MSSPQKVLVTGAAGFIGFHLTQKLTHLGYHVIGIDNINDYYDVNLKKSRLEVLQKLTGFTFYQADLTNKMSTWRHRRVCVIRSLIHTLTWKVIFTGSSIYWRHAGITMYNIWCTPHQAQYMARIKVCHFQFITTSITRYHFMRHRRSQMS